MASKLAQEREEMQEKGLHWCMKCKEFLPSDNFRRGKGKYGLTQSCKKQHDY